MQQNLATTHPDHPTRGLFYCSLNDYGSFRNCFAEEKLLHQLLGVRMDWLSHFVFGKVVVRPGLTAVLIPSLPFYMLRL